MYRYCGGPAPDAGADAAGPESPRAQVLASGVAMPWALNAQRLLAEDWGVAADVWSVTSWTELRRDALAADLHNLLHPGEEVRVPYVTTALAEAPGPVVAVSDWMRAVPDQIARWVPSAAYTSLGTDGFGFSDTRPAARRFFHVDAESIVLAVLSQLADGAVDPSLPAQAIEKYKLNLPVSRRSARAARCPMAPAEPRQQRGGRHRRVRPPGQARPAGT